MSVLKEDLDRLTDGRQAAITERWKMEGGANVCDSFIANIQGLQMRAQKQAEEESWSLERLSFVKRYLQMAIEVSQEMKRASMIRYNQYQGQVQAYEALIQDTRAKFEFEDAKARGDVQAEGGRQVGKHPGPTLAQQRRVESELEEPSETPLDSPPEPTETPQDLTCACGKVCKSIGGLKRHQRACSMSTQNESENRDAEDTGQGSGPE
jgi:hypothetical protein